MVEYIADPANVQQILIDRLPAPSGIKAVNCSTKDNKDGKITGVNASMEYRADGTSKYTACGGSEITGLVPGKYFVRNVASGSKLSSGDTAISVAKYKAAVPKITKQPTDETVNAGEACKYIVKAENAKKYEWHVIDVQDGKDYVIDPEEDKKYYDGIGTDTLTVLSVKELKGECDCEYNGDKYYCNVINDAGKVSTNVVKYTVVHAPNGDWRYDSSDHWQVCYCGTIINKAPHSDADNDGICDVCEYDMANAEVFHILEGANTTWYNGGVEPVVVKADGELKKFKELQIDEDTLDSSDYDTAEGSTIVKIHPEYLNALDNGDHTVSFIYDNGSVSTQLTVTGKEAKALDATNDSICTKANIMIALLMALALILIIAIIVLAKKLRRTR